MSGWHGNHQNELSAVQQYLKLKRDFPEGCGSVSKDKLTWRQPLKPTAISQPYALRVVLAPSSSPKVYVENPCLAELSGGRRLPHVYKQKPPQLCLYRPAYREWLPSMFLSDTIIPWACLWLFYFEDWLITDDWKGGGVHPEMKDEK